MNKKKFLAGALVSASMLGVMLPAGPAFATVVQEEDTTVGIGFGEHEDTKTGNPLEIQWVPKEFDFGSGKTPDASNSQDFVAKGLAEKYVVVSDARDTDPGQQWKLTAKLSDLADGASKLTGASLKFGTTVKGYAGSKAPEDGGSIIGIAGHTAVAPAADVTLAPGGAAVELMHDDGGVSSFKGKTAVEMSAITLTVQAGAALENKNYTGAVTWSLDDTL